MRIELRMRMVYFSPTAGRSYLTPVSAASAEARALLSRKYPSERMERDNIGITNRGWHWSEDERLQRAYSRLRRLILRRFQAARANARGAQRREA